MHAAAMTFVARMAEQIGPVPAVLEIGARNINGTIRPLFAGSSYCGVDLVDGPDVDIVADGATVHPPFPVSLVVCCEVLEHTPQAEAIIAHALDLLPAGGHLLVTCAAPHRAPHSAADGGELRPGEWYQNITPDELETWIRLNGGFPQVLAYSSGQGDVYVWAVKG